ncbi:MAG: hypothetical protein PHD32_11715, partial [Eubacteriales bacterium]|nr:hypothetical protein [Eubacteriales bacterium]
MAFTELPDFQRRQLRTTIILALIIAALIGGYFGIPSLMKHFEPASVSNDVDAAVQAALANYAGRTADDLTPVAARTLDESEQKLQLVFEGVADSATTRAVL